MNNTSTRNFVRYVAASLIVCAVVLIFAFTDAVADLAVQASR